MTSPDVQARVVRTRQLAEQAREASDELETTTDQALIALTRWGLPKNTVISLNASRLTRS